jgi:hypothetical protein
VTTVAAALLVLAAAAARADEAGTHFFPLAVGNWWAYEELDEEGKRLSLETWTVTAGARTGEFDLRSATKRFDGLAGPNGHRWQGHEFLRATEAGLVKRYPAGRDGELEVTLLRAPLAPGTRWHDAQGDCEVGRPPSCPGPRRALDDCAVVVCRLGTPTATVVTSTYARNVGMVRQEIDVVQFLPGAYGAESVLVPLDGPRGGHSVLRLTTFHVTR